MARAKKKQVEEAEVADEEIVIVNEDSIEPTEEISEDQAEEIAAEADEEAEAGDEDMPITQEDVRLVEAILFATSSALSVSNIAERFPEERAKLIPDVLKILQEQYENRGVNLVKRNDRWAFRTATDLGDQLRLEKEQPKKFTRSAMETMAIIAYHQPVTRAEIENIRGVATSPGALDALMEAGWIKPGKRREVPGRPVTWLSTQGFLDHFGLEKLSDLPGMDELKAAGLLDKRPAIEAMPTSDLFGDNENGDDNMEDPQEVTDEDLMGKMDDEDETVSGEDIEDDFEDDEDEDIEDSFDEEEGDDFDDEETLEDDDEEIRA